MSVSEPAERCEPFDRSGLSLLSKPIAVGLGRFDPPHAGHLRMGLLNDPRLWLVAEQVGPAIRRGSLDPVPDVLVMDADVLAVAGVRLLLARGLPDVPIIALARPDGPGASCQPGFGLSFVGELEGAVERLGGWIAAVAGLSGGRQSTAYPDAVVKPETLNLTDRELQVCQLVCEGYRDAEIADELVIELRTVHTHVRSVFGKLDMTREQLTDRRRASAAGGSAARVLPLAFAESGVRGPTVAV